MTRTIEIVVSPDGETKITTSGYTGASCQNATKALERALGQVTSEERTPDFYLPETTGQQEHQQS